MKHKVKVTQVLRIERSTVIEIEADSIEDAIEAIGLGEIDLPPAGNDASGVWVIELSTLESEDYLPA